MSLSVSQFIRLISIVAVIVIHGSYEYQVNFQHTETASLADLIGVLFNQLARFSVPIFVFLSGYGLSIKFKSEDNQSFGQFLKDFYLNRMLRIGVPFLVWTLIFLFATNKIGYFAQIGILGSILKSLSVIGYTIYFTGADYHFYFFTIILWCYLFFPFLVHMIHGNSKLVVIIIFSVLMLFQLIYLSPTHLLFFKFGIHRPVFPSSFFVKWLFYFYCGILLAKKDQNRNQFATTDKQITSPKNFWLTPLIFTIVSFSIVFAEYMFYNNGQNPGNFDHFHRLTVWVYVFSLIWLIRSINVQLTNSKLIHNQIISYLAGISFTVYIIHTSILRILSIDFWGIFLRIVVAILFSFIAAALLDKLLGPKLPKTVRNPLRLALGLPRS